MKYALDHADEGRRLEQQSQLDGYSLSDELGDLPRLSDGKILDAGCGTGLVARHLSQQYPKLQIDGCDGSEIRLADARKLSGKNTNYFVSQLDNIQAANSCYDLVICRYVFEHLLEPQKIANEFTRVIKPGGQLRVINFDGILYNISSENSELREMLNLIEQKSPYNFCIGRQIPSILVQAGFADIHWTVKAVSFQGSSLREEIKLMENRFHFANSFLVQCLSSQERTEDFAKLYIEEMSKPGVILFYNKFIVDGFKA